MAPAARRHYRSRMDTTEAAIDPCLALKQSLQGTRRVDDPVERHWRIRTEARALGLGEDEYKAFLREDSGRSRLHGLLLERPLGRLVSWLGSLSLFKLLEYIGKLAVLLAMGSFLLGIPERTREAQMADLRLIEQMRGQVHSEARQLAIERLGNQCVNLEGLDAARAHLDGLMLPPCYDSMLGSLLGPLMPTLLARRGVLLHGAQLAGAQMPHASLAQADLSGANLAGAGLAQADLSGADLRGADLRGADLFRANLRGARLAGALLDKADLSKSDLRSADLSHARLTQAQLLWADLRRAQLQFATLTGANAIRSDLRDADLYAADLRGTRLRLALTNGRTSLDQAMLQGADLRRTALTPLQLQLAMDGQQASVDGVGDVAPARPQVVLLTYRDSTYFDEVIGAAVTAAHAQHADLVVSYFRQPPAQEAQEEQDQLRSLIDEGATDAIIMSPRHGASTQLLRRAYEAGIALVCYDQCPGAPDRDRYLVADHESDQAAIGRAGGEAVASWVKSAASHAAPTRIGIARFCESEGCYQRLQGFRAALDASGIAWTEAARAGMQGDATPRSAADALLQRRDGAQVFWASNQDGTEGLVDAATAQGLAGQVKVWGTDFSPRIGTMLRAPKRILQAVTAQQPREMGRRAVDSAMAALRRENRAFEDARIPVKRHE